MPFLSPEQERFMFANHPEVAKRWYANYGNADRHMANANPESKTHVTAGPTPDGLPRLGGTKRDFGMLKPSQSARFSPRGKSTPNEIEAHKEGPVEAVIGSKPHPGGPSLNIPQAKLEGNRKRDVATASRHRRIAARRGLASH